MGNLFIAFAFSDQITMFNYDYDYYSLSPLMIDLCEFAESVTCVLSVTKLFASPSWSPGLPFQYLCLAPDAQSKQISWSIYDSCGSVRSYSAD